MTRLPLPALRALLQCPQAAVHTWTVHRATALRPQPQMAATLPEAPQMSSRFAIRYQCYTAGAGCRDTERLA